MAKAITVESIPVIYINARNHFDVGFTIGYTLKHWIEEYVTCSRQMQTLRRFYESIEGRTIVENYLETARKSHVHIVREIEGLAKGSNTDFMDIFLLQLASEILFCHASNPHQLPDSHPDKGCTDILLNGKLCRLIGHNDDWFDDVAPRVSIVDVTISNIDGETEEKFVSYIYPGYLPGFCFGMNKDLVISLNSVKPRDANRGGVPLLILLRSLLLCQSIEGCITTMACKPYGCAYGMAIHIADIRGIDMISIEVYTEKTQSRISTKWIPHNARSDGKPSTYNHVNVYDFTPDPVSQITSEGSERRISRLNELPEPTDIQDVTRILGDTYDPLEPIYRLPNPNHIKPRAKTSATAIFDITERILKVYRGNPNKSKPCVTIPFIE